MDLPHFFKKLRPSRRAKVAKLSLVATVLSILLGSGLYGFINIGSSKPPPALSKQAFPLVEPQLRFGLALDTVTLLTDTILNGQTLSDLLSAAGLSADRIHPLSLEADSLMNIKALRAGKVYHLIQDPDTEVADFFVYQPSVYEYVRLDLQGQGRSERVELPVTTETALAGGVIESSLWNAMVGNGYSYDLTSKMEAALQWSIDFYHVQPDDAFKLVYEKEFVEGQEAAIGPVQAAYYKTGSKEFHAYYYSSEDGSLKGYFDKEGRPMKSGFLKSPLQYGRISSSYNLRRFHPVLKYTRPHYGTDYAAPYGTPILAVGDGVVVEATRRGGNGNFVKIKHSKELQTQYLHMQGFAKGIRPGTHVSQGDVIGYVGSTGLATGPHVCFRFWKDGKQIDHTKLEFPPAAPLPDSLLPDFFQRRDALDAQLELVSLPKKQEVTEVLKP